MNQAYLPRIKNLDIASELDALQQRLKTKAETLQMISDEPSHKLLQVRVSALKMECWVIALCQYALGYSLDQVRAAFSETANAFLRMFELRGTSEAFPVVVVTVDPTKAEHDPAFVIGHRPLHPAGTRDYSLTNSKRC